MYKCMYVCRYSYTCVHAYFCYPARRDRHSQFLFLSLSLSLPLFLKINMRACIIHTHTYMHSYHAHAARRDRHCQFLYVWRSRSKWDSESSNCIRLLPFNFVSEYAIFPSWKSPQVSFSPSLSGVWLYTYTYMYVCMYIRTCIHTYILIHID